MRALFEVANFVDFPGGNAGLNMEVPILPLALVAPLAAIEKEKYDPSLALVLKIFRLFDRRVEEIVKG